MHLRCFLRFSDVWFFYDIIIQVMSFWNMKMMAVVLAFMAKKWGWQHEFLLWKLNSTHCSLIVLISEWCDKEIGTFNKSTLLCFILEGKKQVQSKFWFWWLDLCRVISLLKCENIIIGFCIEIISWVCFIYMFLCGMNTCWIKI